MVPCRLNLMVMVMDQVHCYCVFMSKNCSNLIVGVSSPESRWMAFGCNCKQPCAIGEVIDGYVATVTDWRSCR